MRAERTTYNLITSNDLGSTPAHKACMSKMTLQPVILGRQAPCYHHINFEESSAKALEALSTPEEQWGRRDG